MNATNLILSAAYVNAEISAEFGRLPPSFLPFGHRRLYESQVELFKKIGGNTLLTLPSSFQIDEWDKNNLLRIGVGVIAGSEDVSLGESLLHALIQTGATGPVRILHGDTLFTGDIDGCYDQVGVSCTSAPYDWGAASDPTGAPGRGGEGDETVLAGWFSFSSGLRLMQCLSKAKGDFLEAIALYGVESPMDQKYIEGWLDFGHLQTLYRTRARTTTARSFNSIIVSDHSVLKSSSQGKKLAAEVFWYENIPAPLRIHTPQFLGLEGGGYRVAYQFSPTIQELYVLGRLPPGAWRWIARQCGEFLEKCSKHYFEGHEDHGAGLMVEKTRERLISWAGQDLSSISRPVYYGGSELPSLLEIATETAEAIEVGISTRSVMHGDYCFSNMFFDFREGIVKVIDPRGGFNIDGPSIFGDVRYDLAKLNHSIEGYDLIISGRYEIDESVKGGEILFYEPESHKYMEYFYDDVNVFGHRLTDSDIMGLTIHLFLSMLPLHSDRPDRQRAFLMNALRLYRKFSSRAQ